MSEASPATAPTGTSATSTVQDRGKGRGIASSVDMPPKIHPQAPSRPQRGPAMGQSQQRGTAYGSTQGPSGAGGRGWRQPPPNIFKIHRVEAEDSHPLTQ